MTDCPLCRDGRTWCERCGAGLASLDSVPYLGPNPPPSRAVGLLVKLTAMAAMLGCLATAILDLQAVRLGGDELRRGRSPALVAAIAENNRLAGLAVNATVGAILVHLVMSIVWYSRRRPRAIRERAGEAYVESPLPLTGASWLRRSSRAVALTTCVLLVMSQLSGATTVPQRVERARYSALAYLVLAAGMALRAARVVLADRSHRARLAASQAAREAPTAVGFVPPVTDRQVMRALHGRPPEARH